MLRYQVVHWDDPEISKALLAESTQPHSASKIAVKISKLVGHSVTRNAVIGRLYRMKLSTGYVRQPRPPKQEPRTTKPRAHRERQLPVFGGFCPAGVSGARGLTTRGDNPNIFIPISQRRTLDQLTPETCRWPIGDPKADLWFCGALVADKGAPYCQCHNSIAYRPSRPGHFFRLPR